MSALRKNIYILVTLVFIFSSIGGIASMHTGEMGQKSGCPFMGAEVVCQMGVFEHIRVFQSMFLSVPEKTVLFLVLILSALYLLITITASKVNSQPNPFQFFTRKSLHLPNFNKILLALSDGRLQPKLYA